MSTSTIRRGDRGLGKTATGANAGSWASHDRQQASPPAAGSGDPLDRSFDTLEEKIEVMSEEVGKLVADLKDDKEWNDFLATMSRFHQYSFTNQLLIARQKPDATRVGGKTLWKSLGREVKPYEDRGRGISIFRPRIGWVDKTDQAGNVVTGSDGKPLRERRVFGYSATTIYDVSQTQGDPLPGETKELTETPPEGFAEDLDQAITSYGYTVQYGDLPPGVKGRTSEDGTVTIANDMTPADQTRVKAHELGHIAAGHMDRAADGEYHVGAGGQRGAMEVEADSISHVLLRINGMDPSDSTGRYIAGWSSVQSDDDDVVKNSAALVQKTVKSLVAEQSWQNVEELPKSEPTKRKTRRKK